MISDKLLETPRNYALTIKGTDIPGMESKKYSVTIGVGTIKKVPGNYNPSTHEIEWNVTVDTKGQTLGGNLRALDLLVYENSNSFNINSIDNVDAGFGTPGTLEYVSKDVLANLTPRYRQRINKDSFSSGNGLTHQVYTLTSGGKAVADLMVVTDNGSGISSAANTYSYRSIVSDPNCYAANGGYTMYNTASLFSNDKKLNDSTASIKVQSNMLAKDSITRDKAAVILDETNALSDTAVITAVNGGSAGQSVDKSFDYVDKSVIYRIFVNANNNTDVTNDITTIDGEKLGNYIIQDTLPKGWEFQQIKGNDFVIYEGTGSGAVVKAVSQALDTSFMTVTKSAGTDTNGESMVFDFTALTKPYVILVKAGPSEDTLKEYFSSNKDYTVKNKVSFVYNDKITANVEGSKDTKISSTVLDKSYTKNEDGWMTWSIDYKPYDMEYSNIYLTDTIPLGIDLRVDSKGELVIADNDGVNIKVSELILQKDGQYTEGTVLSLPDENILTYDNASRILKFTPPEAKKSYRITYITDITGEPGTISNKVQLFNGDAPPVNGGENYSISDADYGASFSRSGWFKIKKEDGNSSQPIPGVIFAVFSTEGVVIREAVTNASGILTLKALPEGDYILKEKSAPADYVLSEKEYKVNIKKLPDGSMKTTIEGKELADDSTITIDNFKAGTVGNLTLTKSVAGTGGETDKEFDFTVELKDAADAVLADSFDYVINNRAGDTAAKGILKSGDKIALSHGQTLKVMDIPKETKYIITEDDYSSEGYVTSVAGIEGTVREASGTIEADITKNVSFTNTKNIGGLVISKTVTGNGGDKNKQFDFTVELDAAGSFDYIGAGGAADGKIKSGDIIQLRDGESISIKGIPENTKYSVTEDDYSKEGYITTKTGETGIVNNDHTSAASFNNARNVGKLVIDKTVKGNGGDKKKAFEFTVTFDGTGKDKTFDYIGKGIADGTIKSGDKIMLAHDQSVTIQNIPEGTTYSVTEADYSKEGYITSKTGDKGTIKDGVENPASFINSRNTGSLEIKKTVEGNAGDKKKAFEFILILEGLGAEDSYSYKGTGVADGSIKSGDSILLADGQSVLIDGLLEGLTYSVEEKDYSGEGYVTTKTGTVGKIEGNKKAEAVFVNAKNEGTLSIMKTVEGNGGDKEKEFEFIVTFKGKGAEDTYFYKGTGVADGKIKSGDTILLADNQSVMIEGLPEGISYVVEEGDYTKEGYVTEMTGDKGVIKGDTASVAHFINTRNIKETDKEDDKPQNGGSTDSNPPSSSDSSDSSNITKTAENSKISDGVLPKTGREQRVIYYILGAFCFAAGIFVLIHKDKKKNAEK